MFRSFYFPSDAFSAYKQLIPSACLAGAPTQPANRSSSKFPWGVWLLEVMWGGMDTAPHPPPRHWGPKEKWQLKTSTVENKCRGGGGAGE